MALSIAQAQKLVALMITEIEVSHNVSNDMIGRLENARNAAAKLSEGGYNLAVVQAVLAKSAAVLEQQRAQVSRFNDLLMDLRSVA